jgi:hypothetical protein
VLACIRIVRDVPYTGPRGVDVVGSDLSVLGMGGIVLGILVWQEGGESVGALLAIGAIAMGVLVWWLARRKRLGKPKLLDPDLFTSKMFNRDSRTDPDRAPGRVRLSPRGPTPDSGIWDGLVGVSAHNYTLSPISDERVSEAAAANSAAGSFGLSFGLAFAGVIMLATLSISFTALPNRALCSRQPTSSGWRSAWRTTHK